MFKSIEEFKKIYNSMNENYEESLKEYREYIETHSSFYITRRKHMKNYIREKLTQKGYEILEQTEDAIKKISIACKTYAIYKNGKDLFEILLLADANIMNDYLNTMSDLAISKNNKSLKAYAEVEMDTLNKKIAEKISKNKIQETVKKVAKNKSIEK